ncbi:MAG: 4-hydroxyphenylacetate 3-hydroxylase N-terminal domain-containing protein, partial [Actinomycetota bacterium]
MPARTGRQYIEALNNSSRDVQVHGERVEKGLAEHPAFRGVVGTYAQLFDMQHDPKLADMMTYESPTSGDRVGMSFLQPKSVEDLIRRRTMIKTWSDYSLGQLGRTGDYLNSAIMAMASASD